MSLAPVTLTQDDRWTELCGGLAVLRGTAMDGRVDVTVTEGAAGQPWCFSVAGAGICAAGPANGRDHAEKLVAAAIKWAKPDARRR